MFKLVILKKYLKDSFFYCLTQHDIHISMYINIIALVASSRNIAQQYHCAASTKVLLINFDSRPGNIFCNKN